MKPATAITVLAAILFIAAAAPAEEGVLFEGDSIYHHITVRQDRSERCMIFGRHRDLRQTCMDLGRPDHSLFEYSAMMMTGFLFKPESRKVCLIGLGGGYIPTFFSLHLPAVELHIVEVDPLVEKLARQYFNFRPPSNQRLFIEDGRQFLKKSRESYDQIWLDAFNSDYIPAHLTTKEFLRLAKSRLAEGGLLLQNVFAGSSLYDAQVATLRSVFAKVLVFTGQHSGSAVLVAGDGRNPTMDRLQREVERFGGRIGPIDLRAEVKKCGPAASTAKAPVLTDDFNPANLLLMQKR